MTIKATSRILLAFAALISMPASSQAPLTQVVKRITPSVTLASVPANNVPRVAGSPVQFNMNITGVSAAAPTGSIQFTVTSLDGSTPLSGTGVIAAGLASWTSTPTPAGFSIAASYGGDVNYLPVSVTIPAPPAEDFDFTLPAVTVAQGATWNGTMQVVSLNGFSWNDCVDLPECPAADQLPNRRRNGRLPPLQQRIWARPKHARCRSLRLLVISFRQRVCSCWDLHSPSNRAGACSF
jgi:hypothetical protein